MTIRKGKLWKICRRCGNKFRPSGKYTFVCNKHRPTGKTMDGWLKIQDEKKNNN